MAGTTHFPNGIEADSYSINGVVQNHKGGHNHAGNTHFPHGITTNVLTVGGTVILGSGTPTTHFHEGVDVNEAITIA